MQLDNVCAIVRAPVAGSTALLLSCHTLISALGSTVYLLSCVRSHTGLSCLFACPVTLTALFYCLLPAPVLLSLAVLLFFPVLGLACPHLASIAFKTLKQALSD